VNGNGANGDAKRFHLVRAYVLLVVGVGLVTYSLVGMIEPAVLTLGGALLGADPLIRSAAK
jgi:hypothetical protein